MLVKGRNDDGVQTPASSAEVFKAALCWKAAGDLWMSSPILPPRVSCRRGSRKLDGLLSLGFVRVLISNSSEDSSIRTLDTSGYRSSLNEHPQGMLRKCLIHPETPGVLELWSLSKTRSSFSGCLDIFICSVFLVRSCKERGLL